MNNSLFFPWNKPSSKVNFFAQFSQNASSLTVGKAVEILQSNLAPSTCAKKGISCIFLHWQKVMLDWHHKERFHIQSRSKSIIFREWQFFHIKQTSKNTTTKSCEFRAQQGTLQWFMRPSSSVTIFIGKPQTFPKSNMSVYTHFTGKKKSIQ